MKWVKPLYGGYINLDVAQGIHIKDFVKSNPRHKDMKGKFVVFFWYGNDDEVPIKMFDTEKEAKEYITTLVLK